MYSQEKVCSAEPVAESKLAASLAHEINNPLDSVLNLLYLVKTESALTETGRHYLSLAEEELQRVSKIAQAALDRTREFGALRETNVPTLMDSVIDVYRLRFEARGISVSTRYGADGVISAYSGPLRQVFSNLLLNAADAMPKAAEGCWHEYASHTSGRRTATARRAADDCGQWLRDCRGEAAGNLRTVLYHERLRRERPGALRGERRGAAARRLAAGAEQHTPGTYRQRVRDLSAGGGNGRPGNYSGRICRAMMRRWISLVPSPMVQSLTSR